SPAAERGDLRRLLDDRPPAPARALRALGGAGMRLGVGSQLRRNLITLLVLAFLYSVIAMFVTNSYYQLILTLVPVWALFGVSWNILSGYGGQLSFGHAAFFGIGAYTVTLGMVYWSLSPWVGIPLGMVIGGLAALAIGTPTFRLRGHYFALSMLAYPLAILYVLQYLGFQEVSMPMHRAHAPASRPRPRLHGLPPAPRLHAHRRGPAGGRRRHLPRDRELALRPGVARYPAERARGGGGGHQLTPLEDAFAGGLGHDGRR